MSCTAIYGAGPGDDADGPPPTLDYRFVVSSKPLAWDFRVTEDGQERQGWFELEVGRNFWRPIGNGEILEMELWPAESSEGDTPFTIRVGVALTDSP